MDPADMLLDEMDAGASSPAPAATAAAAPVAAAAAPAAQAGASATHAAAAAGGAASGTAAPKQSRPAWKDFVNQVTAWLQKYTNHREEKVKTWAVRSIQKINQADTMYQDQEWHQPRITLFDSITSEAQKLRVYEQKLYEYEKKKAAAAAAAAAEAAAGKAAPPAAASSAAAGRGGGRGSKGGATKGKGRGRGFSNPPVTSLPPGALNDPALQAQVPSPGLSNSPYNAAGRGAYVGAPAVAGVGMQVSGVPGLGTTVVPTGGTLAGGKRPGTSAGDGPSKKPKGSIGNVNKDESADLDKKDPLASCRNVLDSCEIDEGAEEAALLEGGVGEDAQQMMDEELGFLDGNRLKERILSHVMRRGHSHIVDISVEVFELLSKAAEWRVRELLEKSEAFSAHRICMPQAVGKYGMVESDTVQETLARLQKQDELYKLQQDKEEHERYMLRLKQAQEAERRKKKDMQDPSLREDLKRQRDERDAKAALQKSNQAAMAAAGLGLKRRSTSVAMDTPMSDATVADSEQQEGGTPSMNATSPTQSAVDGAGGATPAPSLVSTAASGGGVGTPLIRGVSGASSLGGVSSFKGKGKAGVVMSRRLTLRDLLMTMERDARLRKSKLLYKSYFKLR